MSGGTSTVPSSIPQLESVNDQIQLDWDQCQELNRKLLLQ